MDNKGKEGSFAPIYIAMLVSLLVAFLWAKISFIHDWAHAILDPTAGALLNWNVNWGMVIIVFILSYVIMLVQKYGTDQKTLKEMKKEQKRLNEEMKKVKDTPDKFMEMQKESMKLMGPMMKLSMRPIVYTAIPLILFFRWFQDYFGAVGNPHILGIFSWFWFYLIFSIIFSSILRKWMDVA